MTLYGVSLIDRRHNRIVKSFGKVRYENLRVSKAVVYTEPEDVFTVARKVYVSDMLRSLRTRYI